MLSQRRIFYATISGLLLCLPWYEHFSGLWLCISLVPLLLLEDSFLTTPNQKPGPIFLYASITFFLWNAGTTWWIINASFAGAGAAILINTFLYSTLFYLYHITNKIAGNLIGKIAFVTYWVSFEYFYLNAEISWPWLNLGNGFGQDIRLIQWYEYTGTLGGTTWVLIVNLLIFEAIKRILSGKSIKEVYSILLASTLTLLVPIVISESRYRTYHEKKVPCQIVVIQPNVDPYDNSFSVVDECANLLHLADSAGSASTNYFVAPEVTIEDNVWENNMENNYSVPLIQNFIHRLPHADFIYGSYTYKRYSEEVPKSPTAQYSKFQHFYFDSYNTAIQLGTSKKIQLYHKSKLVVGVEKMPYPKTLKFLQKIVERYGGSFVSYGTQNFRSVFESTDKKFRIAPVICYESIYGEYVTDYIRNGANFIFIITNDGWLGNTPGHRQHLGYSRLRAIETRRSIARSANTGISAFIDQKGDIIKSLGWDKRGAMECTLNANDYQTFYVKHGDYLGKISSQVSVGIILISLLILATRKKFL